MCIQAKSMLLLAIFKPEQVETSMSPYDGANCGNCSLQTGDLGSGAFGC